MNGTTVFKTAAFDRSAISPKQSLWNGVIKSKKSYVKIEHIIKPNKNMDLFEAIEKRHMCRSLDPDKEVPDDLIGKLVDAGKRAPSAGGLKDQRFTVVKDKETKNKLMSAALDQEQVGDASAVIIVSSEINLVMGKYGERGRDLYSAQNCAAAAENILLAVTALGLSACWVGAFDENPVKEILGLPKNYRPMVMIPVGYEK
jgi:nitroreductase